MDFTKPEPYPEDAFHLLILEAVRELIRRIKGPSALIAMEALQNISICVQGIYDVLLPTGQVRPTSLNVVVVADSGERKSAVHSALAAPLYEFDLARIRMYTVDMEDYEREARLWKAEQTGVLRRVTKLTQDGEATDEIRIKLAVHDERKPIKPKLRRIMRQNITQRALMDALEGDGESIAFVSDEGELITKGGVLNQTGLLNKAWDGAPMLVLDRSDGVNVIVRNPRVTTAWTCPCITGHVVTLRLMNFLAGGIRVASGISGRCADAIRCSGRTRWPGFAAPSSRQALASTKRNRASSF